MNSDARIFIDGIVICNERNRDVRGRLVGIRKLGGKFDLILEGSDSEDALGEPHWVRINMQGATESVLRALCSKLGYDFED